MLLSELDIEDILREKENKLTSSYKLWDLRGKAFRNDFCPSCGCKNVKRTGMFWWSRWKCKVCKFSQLMYWCDAAFEEIQKSS